jgi:hypothetical protein
MRSTSCIVALAIALGACQTHEDAVLADTAPGERVYPPARLRRLTNAEFDATAAAVLGVVPETSATLPADVRQSGFSRNAAQSVSTLLAYQARERAHALAAAAVQNRISELAPCNDAEPGACADAFIRTAGRRAYRRALTEDELARYRRLYDSAATGGGYAAGVQLVLETLLQSPSLWYVSELGTDHGGGVRTLTSMEIASSLSYLVTGAPPDDELLEAGEADELRVADERERHVRRLLRKSSTRFQFRRFVQEWLGIEKLWSMAKDREQYPDFEALRPAMLEETNTFVDEVLSRDGASLSALLTANYSLPPPALAARYGAEQSSSARQPIPERIGILQHASFLASHAHESESAPVLRGVAVLERVLCQKLPSPSEIQIIVTRPPPESTLTTRQRFERHLASPECSQCHASIDAFGNTFENFDALGMLRANENGMPIDTATLYFDERFADSVALSHWLAAQPGARECFARQLFRFASADDDAAAEQRFVGLVADLPEPRRSSLLEMVVAYVRSDLFVKREAQ